MVILKSSSLLTKEWKAFLLDVEKLILTFMLIKKDINLSNQKTWEIFFHQK